MDTFSLLQLNRVVSETIRETFPDTYWLTAEISDVRTNTSGHCYLEFMEKDPVTGNIIARAKGNIWNNTFRMLKPYFEQTTGQLFTSGIKILVKVSVDFHELYGFALNVTDIDPTYTLGDMEKQRQQILQQLETEGVLNLNKELDFPLLPQRVAVITSETAAGYEDFLHQLDKNPGKFIFYPKLFPAVMQGEKTEESVIAALDKIYEHKDLFDIVVIIRGGGSTSDLHCFDSYLLATNCAQFPLPIITGIGHERDKTILDFVAHTRAKTPTAVAEFLIDSVQNAYAELIQSQQSLIASCEEKISQGKHLLQASAYSLQSNIAARMEKLQASLQLYQAKIMSETSQYLSRKKHKLDVGEQFLLLSSPQHVLSRGYSITLKNGKAIKSVESLHPGDLIETVFEDGRTRSKVL